MPPRFTRSQLLHYLGLNRYCDQTSPQGCLLWINERIQLTQHVGFLQVQNGDYVKIAVPPSNALEPSIATRAAAAVCHRGHSLNDVVIWHLTTGLSHEDEILLPLQHPGNTDDLSLMQIHTSLVVPHYEFDPQKPWRNQLFELWKQGLRTDETNSALPRIATHFLDHRKIFRNDVRRIVELSPNFEEWETTIGQAWVDRLDASIGYRIDCVFPHPLTMDHGLIGYILITQNCDPTKASALFSIYDSEVNAWVENHVALVIPRITMKQHLIEICGFAQQCQPRGTSDCQLQHVDRIFSDHEIIPTEMGMGFSLEIKRSQEECSQAQTPPHDDIAFLQTKLQTCFHNIGNLLQERAYANWLNVCSLEDHPPGFHFKIPESPAEDIARIVQANEERARLVQQEARFFQLTQVPLRLHHVFETLQADFLRNPAPDFQPCIATWYLNPNTAWRCNLARIIELPDDVSQWIPTIRNRWQDEWDDAVDGAFYPVHPIYPDDLEAGISAHVLIIQHEMPHVHGILVSMYDNALHQGSVHRFAVLHEGDLSHDDLLDHADRDQLCAIPGMHCQSWFGWNQIQPQVPLPITHGNGVVLSIYRPNFVQPDPAAWDDFQALDDDGLDLLQRSHQINHKTRIPISLEELLGVPDEDKVIVRLLPGASISLLPPWLEMPRHWNSDSIVMELHSWGHFCQAISLEPHDIALCFPHDCVLPNTLWHYAYVNEDIKDQDSVILHSSHVSLDVKGHMKFLHSRGFSKAVVQSQHFHQVGICIVRFLLSHGHVDLPAVKVKRPSAWPAQQTACHNQEALHQPLPTPILHHTDCLLRSPVTFNEVGELLTSARDILCTSFEGLDLPETCAQACHWCGHGLPSCVDRLLIYTDGSSPGGSRLTVPESTMHGECQFDTWAFLVVGETYNPGPNQPKFHLVGWNAQPVLYNPECTQHLFADRLGSDVAEREALFFAGLWRLGLPSSVPTIFRPDSLSTCLQAEGRWGTASPGPAFRALRGIFQALKALLPGDHLQFAHVTSHVGEPFNDFVDFAAKGERIKSYYHQRQPVDLHKWVPVLPYLWMFLDKNAGLPPLHIHGFSAEAPDLPGHIANVPEDSQISATLDLPLEWDCNLKLATANVGSLSSGPEGHGGKLDYLRQQFVAHRFHFLGVQESRASACSSHIDGVYRLASGCLARHFGVELWINTTLPFASCGSEKHCFKPKDFTVVLSTPRFLLTRLECDFLQAWILVAHAPQSGRALSERESWWQDLSDQIQAHHTGLPLFVLVDANASAGGGDGVHVFSHDTVSANTRFFRDFIEQFDLCLPSTGALHQGSGITWRSPDGGIEKRIDYVAIPISWNSRCTASFVLHTLISVTCLTIKQFSWIWLGRPFIACHLRLNLLGLMTAIALVSQTYRSTWDTFLSQIGNATLKTM